LFARFGIRLQAEGSFKEAEFVQKLALRLQADQYFTNLPLAATYHETGRYSEALPLFERGLAQLKNFEADIKPESRLSPAQCLGHDAEIGKLSNHYREIYEACLKAAGKSLPSFCSVIFVELVCAGGRLDLF
jgi:tetratricopeptide (TPR) repeat protein